MLKIFRKYKKIILSKNKKGVSLVIAITTMTLLLSVSLSISNIVLRQIKINTLTNNSKPAFFIADSAMECAMYYDTASTTDTIINGVNINSDFNTAIFGSSTRETFDNIVKCGKGVKFVDKTYNGLKITTNFDIDYGDYCAKVNVLREDVRTSITARGYNTKMNSSGCDLTNVDSRRVVERGLTITY